MAHAVNARPCRDLIEYSLVDDTRLLVAVVGKSPRLKSPNVVLAMVGNMNSVCDVSVVIPAYNRAPLLEKTLISFKQQTLDVHLYEIIVVDDGSTENLKEVVEKVRKDHGLPIRYYYQTHQGPGKARNLGISKAQSALIALTDSDVLPQHDWLEKGLLAFQKENGVVAVEGKTIVPDKEKITPFTHQTENLQGGRYHTCNLFVEKAYCRFYPLYTSNFREDSDLAFSILQKGHKILFDPEVITFHPVLQGRFTTPFRLAMRYEFDPLLKKRFPQFYKNNLDAHSILGRKIPHLRKKISAVYLLSCGLLIGALLGGKAEYWQPILGVYLLTLACNYYVHLRLCLLKRTGLRTLVGAFLVAALVPFVMYGALMKGYWRFRKSAGKSRTSSE